ncbi:MAG: class I SAM-dependent methyltransferase [Candidatus Viridilinea halotolerans]|uniref:Class I SAM-dependent methyltransferase n=1 Tax=Candidatus Viridilinea halotolerans TaxID=2491704 RepID=A0A426TQ98_9CHLR|nr:MAG: class I SAM-dependent methyltransferase [Candidatus Viridilinea halotolerans]
MLYRRIIQRLFYHFYRELAWSYDAVAWLVSAGLWQRWALVAVPKLRGRTLELGFGPGYVQLALADGAGCAGLDASPQMVRRAAQRLRRVGHWPRLVRGVAQQLPFAAASFDSVVATFPAEYILDAQTHHEIRRVLVPGGRVVIIPSAELAPGAYRHLVDLAYALTLMSARASADGPSTSFALGDLHLQATWVSLGPSRVMVLEGEI